MTPGHTPSTASSRPSGQTTTAADTNRADRFVVFPRSASNLRRLSAYVASSPAKRAAYTPGAPLSASTNRPVSSLTAAIPDGCSLQPGVADERVGGLGNLGRIRWARQQVHDTFEDRSHLGHLVGIRGGADELHLRGVVGHRDSGLGVGGTETISACS